MTATVIGAGLAGCEAAMALARAGVRVRLFEMKPLKMSPAHHSGGFAELVCSNSLKSEHGASGMLKEEMKLLGSITLEAAYATRVPAGGALAVNRDLFSEYITNAVRNQPLIEVAESEVTEFPRENTVIATGPLTSEAFAAMLSERLGGMLSFYDASAPIVTAESIDMTRAFYGCRYGKGDPRDYINCPLSRDEYRDFYGALVSAQTAPLHDFENLTVFEGCMPVEILAKRGEDSLRFGCMKPVGFGEVTSRDGSRALWACSRARRSATRPYAVVQLRMEDTAGTLRGLVGFQTNLTFGEQKRVFRMLPGLENAEFVRYGVMHRNTFINSPKLLDSHFKLRGSDGIYFGGQITGVEGYMESAASGIICGISLARQLRGLPPLELPPTTITGALSNYICGGTMARTQVAQQQSMPADFQPMNANMGILPPLDLQVQVKGKQERHAAIAARGVRDLENVLENVL